MLDFSPMTRTLKIFLLWLLIAVIPLQAMAANVLRECSSAPRGMTMVATSMHHGDVVATSHGCASDQQSGGHEECAEMASLDDQSNDASKFSEHGSCSACAACCMGTFAPLQLMPIKPFHNSAELYVAYGTIAFAGFIPDSLERPPRHPAA
jgi:hypothetical protein